MLVPRVRPAARFLPHASDSRARPAVFGRVFRETLRLRIVVFIIAVALRVNAFRSEIVITELPLTKRTCHGEKGWRCLGVALRGGEWGKRILFIVSRVSKQRSTTKTFPIRSLREPCCLIAFCVKLRPAGSCHVANGCGCCVPLLRYVCLIVAAARRHQQRQRGRWRVADWYCDSQACASTGHL